MSTPSPLPPPAAADAAHSRYVQRIRRRYAAQLPLLAPGVPDRASMRQSLAALQAAGHALPAALRVMRHLVVERLGVLDVEAGAPLEAVTGAMTQLAEVVLCEALAAARAELDAAHGAPRDARAEVIPFWILGMGKLGGRELNVSSDIDLIYVYDEEGESDGRRPLSAHEYFARLAKKLYALVGEVTEDGQVFRVDLALRPHGNSGPPAMSLAALEAYLMGEGREWERFAWLKSRVVAPDMAQGVDAQTQALRTLVTPFVYRRYLDYGVFEGLRQLHRKIREEAQRRASGRPERESDVKLGRGGIREIEFIAQLMQVVRGGQFPEIRTRSTVKALHRLAARGLLPQAAAEQLAQGYAFLRRIEHRIQYLDDQQTHCLPTQPTDLDWIARSLGFASTDGPNGFLAALAAHRERIEAEFDALLHEAAAPQTEGDGADAVDSEVFWSRLPLPLAGPVARWAQQPRVTQLREPSKRRLSRLIQRAAQSVDRGEVPPETVLRLLDWMEPLLRREAYLALLAERPAVLLRLLRLLGLARWPMRYLLRHPGVIDELADERLLHQRFDFAAFRAELQARHDVLARHGEADEEVLLDTVRHAHHAEVFRTLVRDVEGQLTVEQVADDLSLLADATLQTVIDWVWARFKPAHRPDPQLAVIAYGKLGGKELGYGGDLDVVFLFDDDHEDAAHLYGQFVRKLITWLTLRTAAGELFDIDTALRPNGSSGLLVTSLAAYADYQQGRGSNAAWTWEHQAITRARFCAGDCALAERFEAVRTAVLTAPRDAAALRAEVAAMREKVAAAHPVAEGRFDVKHSPGGMMDAEFALQAVVLTHAAAHPLLRPNTGVIALLRAAEAAALLPAGVGVAAGDAYRALRHLQHRARLDETTTALDADAQVAGDVPTHAAAIRALWQASLGASR